MKKSKIVSLVLAFAMLASMAVPTMAAEAEIMPISAPVTEGHWSDAAMGRWAEVGVFKGDQYGDFMPDKEMTRAEFAQVLVNLMGYTAVAENTYADIPADAWYADAMLKLVAAGVMQGTGYNEVGAIVSPLAPISREQTAVLLCRALSLKPSADAKIDFPDAASVSDWAKDAVAALTERGMLNGTGDGNVSPALVIDRGSVAQMVSNMVSEYVTKDGAVVTGDQKGIVIVAAKEVSFQNAKLAETVVVAPKAAKASVTFTDGTTAADVVVSAEGATVTVGKSASVESVTLDATKAAVTVNGKVGTVTVNATADNADVTANQGAKIGTVTTAAAGTDITGAKNTIGTIVAEATATGAKVSASGATLENKSSETIGKVAPGETGKAPGGANNTVIGGGSSSHTGTYKITNDVDTTKGRVSVKVGGSEATSANAGETVTVTVTANKGYKVTEVYAINKDTNAKIAEDTNEIKFTMPAAVKGVVVSAGFEVAPVEPEEPEPAEPIVYTFESKDLTACAAGDKVDGATETAGTEDYFTIIYSAKTKVDKSEKTWDDNYTSAQRLNFGGSATTEKNSVKFTTKNPATVKIWFVQGGADNRQMTIFNEDKSVEVTSAVANMAQNSPYYCELSLSAADTYYLGTKSSNNNIYKIVVEEESSGETPVEPEKTYKIGMAESIVTTYKISADSKVYTLTDDVVTYITEVNGVAAETAKTGDTVELTAKINGEAVEVLGYTYVVIDAAGEETVNGATFEVANSGASIKEILLLLPNKK